MPAPTGGATLRVSSGLGRHMLRSTPLALSLTAALAGCDDAGGLPCPDDDPQCEPSAGGLTLSHGSLVIGAGAAVDDVHALEAILAVGAVQSRAGRLERGLCCPGADQRIKPGLTRQHHDLTRRAFKSAGPGVRRTRIAQSLKLGIEISKWHKARSTGEVGR